MQTRDQRRQKQREVTRAWRARNMDRIRAYHRAWSRRSRDKINASVRAAYARRRTTNADAA